MKKFNTDEFQPRISIDYEPTNPGQVFACLGLLELVEHYYKEGAEGWFEDKLFHIHLLKNSEINIKDLFDNIKLKEISERRNEEEFKHGILIMEPFNILVDWWLTHYDYGETGRLKTWSGKQNPYVILSACLQAIKDNNFLQSDLQSILNKKSLIYKGKEIKKPFYFDARLGARSTALDVGYSLFDVGTKIISYPLVDFFCFIGLQYGRPLLTDEKNNIFDYYLWNYPLSARLIPLGICGEFHKNQDHYIFKCQLRSIDRKYAYKAFLRAIKIKK